MRIDPNIGGQAMRHMLQEIAASHGHPISSNRAEKIARKIRRGDFSPELAAFLPYADPTGELATHNAMGHAA